MADGNPGVIYAKSNPVETLQEHTNTLLENLEILKNLYEDKILRILGEDSKNFWELLKLACIYHDVGKVYSVFQNEIRKRLNIPLLGVSDLPKIPHNYLSTLFIDKKHIKTKFGKKAYKTLFQAVLFHHKRDEKITLMKDFLNTIFEKDLRERGIAFLREFGLDLSKPNFDIVNLTRSNIRIKKFDEEYKLYVMLKGFLHRLDHSASAHLPVEVKINDHVNLKVKSYIHNKLRSSLRENQKFCVKNKNENLILIASTGMGKTESSLLWSNGDKTFYTLPLRAALNSLYIRTIQRISYKNVGLLHSMSFEIMKDLFDDFETAYITYQKSRQFSYRLIFTTIDQIFPFVFLYPGYEKILSSLAYSRVVVDEVQSYSPDILAVLFQGIKMINEFGGKFMIMTATAPDFFIEDLQNAVNFKIGEFYLPYIRHKISIHHYPLEDDLEKILESSQNKKVLVIVNTVKKSKEIYRLLKDRNAKVWLLHARFTRKDKREKEKQIEKFASANGKNGIWVTTQIAEVSLDVDFDILFSELSTLDSLFQRMGRCYRKRKISVDSHPNVHIYTEGISGIRGIYDKDIHNISKEIIRDFDGKILSEKVKSRMIREAYDISTIKDTNYYKKFTQAKEFVQTIPDYSTQKNEVHKILRKFQTVDVIPIEFYKENYHLFKKLKRLKKQKRTPDIKMEITEVMRNIEDMIVSIPAYAAREIHPVDEIRGVFYIDAPYSRDEGIILDSQQEEEDWIL